MGDKLPYTVVVANTGNITLDHVIVSDSLVDLSAIKPVESVIADGVLAVGETWTYTYTYTITQADLDRGHVLNTASAAQPSDPDDPDDPGVPPTEDDIDIPADQFPSMTIQKTSTATTFRAAGEKLSYTVVVANTGNITLDHVIVSDSLVDLSAIKPVESVAADGVLAVGETWTYTYTYTVDADDVTAGVVFNRASVKSSASPKGKEATHTVPITESPKPPPPDQVPATGETPGSNALGLMLLVVAALIELMRRRLLSERGHHKS